MANPPTPTRCPTLAEYPEPSDRNMFAQGSARKDFAESFYTEDAEAWRNALLAQGTTLTVTLTLTPTLTPTLTLTLTPTLTLTLTLTLILTLTLTRHAQPVALGRPDRDGLRGAAPHRHQAAAHRRRGGGCLRRVRGRGGPLAQLDDRCG